MTQELRQQIRVQLDQHLAPEYIELVDESFKHNVPRGAQSHWKLLIVARSFEGKPPVQRHRAVYQALAEQLNGPIHALAIDALTPKEWHAKKPPLSSPRCLGGGGR